MSQPSQHSAPADVFQSTSNANAPLRGPPSQPVTAASYSSAVGPGVAVSAGHSSYVAPASQASHGPARPQSLGGGSAAGGGYQAPPSVGPATSHGTHYTAPTPVEPTKPTSYAGSHAPPGSQIVRPVSAAMSSVRSPQSQGRGATPVQPVSQGTVPHPATPLANPASGGIRPHTSVVSAGAPLNRQGSTGSWRNAGPTSVSAVGSVAAPAPPQPQQPSADARRHLSANHAAQQAAILASMSKAHEKMLREIYYQKLKRQQNNKNEARLEAANRTLQERVQELEAAAVVRGAGEASTTAGADAGRVLYVDPISQPSRSVMWFAEFAGIAVTFKYVDLAAQENRQTWYLAKNAEGQVPYYEEDNGAFGVAESTAILEYLAETSGKLALAALPLGTRSYVNAYFARHACNTRQLTTKCFLPFLMAAPAEKEGVLQDGLREVAAIFQGFEALFASQAYVAGAEPTLADFLCGPELDQFSLIDQLGAYPNIQRYLNDLRGARGCDHVRQEAFKRWQELGEGVPLAQPAPRGQAPATAPGAHHQDIKQNYAAQQAGIIASMSKAHEKMLREIYYQKLKRTQNNKKEGQLQQRVVELEAENAALKEAGARGAGTGAGAHHQDIKQNYAAQQAGIIASMSKAHEKMLREIYYQKLKRTQNNKKEAELQALRAAHEALEQEVQQLRDENSYLKRREDAPAAPASTAGGAAPAHHQDIKQNYAAQQAGIIASMSKAHEKMLREIYYQKLKRTQNNKKEGQLQAAQQELATTQAENAQLREENARLKGAAEAPPATATATSAAISAPRPASTVSRPVAEPKEEPPTTRAPPTSMIENRHVSPLKPKPGAAGTPVGAGASSPHVPAGGPGLEAKVNQLEARIMHMERYGSPVRTRPADHTHSPPPTAGSASPAQHQQRMVAYDNGTVGVTAPGVAAPGVPLPGVVGFSVRVACDVHGIKRNVRLQFPTVPRILTLVNAVNTVYDVVARGSHPPGCPDVPFNLAALQIFDSPQQRWVDLSDPMLHAGASDPQLFCFQQASIWHPDRPGTIPPAESVHTFVTGDHAPPRLVTTNPPPSQSAMVLSVFKDVDVVGGGRVRFQDLRDALRRYGVEILSKTVGEVFTAMDTRQDGVVTSDEWVAFGRDQPRFIETLYFKSLDANGAAMSPEKLHYNRPGLHPQDLVTSRVEAAADQLAPPYLPGQGYY